jgi:hypothetical protein
MLSLALNSLPLELGTRGIMPTKHSYFWHQAQVCMSLARVTNDPVLKERYEDLALDFAQKAERERDLDSVKPSDPQNRQE